MHRRSFVKSGKVFQWSKFNHVLESDKTSLYCKSSSLDWSILLLCMLLLNDSLFPFKLLSADRQEVKLGSRSSSFVFSCVRWETGFTDDRHSCISQQRVLGQLHPVSWRCQQMCWLVKEGLCSCICSVQRLCPLPGWIWTSWLSGRSIQDPDKGRPRCYEVDVQQR